MADKDDKKPSRMIGRKKKKTEIPDKEVQVEVSELRLQLPKQLIGQWHTQVEHTIYICAPWRNVAQRDLLYYCSFDNQSRVLKPEAWLE